jgi:voltage-gated potassium channel
MHMAPGQTSRRNVRNSMLALAVFAVVSTAGFYGLGLWAGVERGWLECLRYTASIFSTVGDMPRREPFTPAETLWEILMIIFGIGVAVWAFSSIMALVTGGEIQRMLGRRELFGKIRSLDNHYIVCGHGRMGQSIARSLARSGQSFVVIDKDAERTSEAEERDYLYILGDATDENILSMAGVHRAKGLVACLPHDADNVFATLTARELNARLTIIARAEQESTERRLLNAGASRVICPPVIGAMKVTRMLLHPAVEDMLDATMSGEFALDRVNVDDMPAVNGKTLRELALPSEYGLMVLAVQRGDGSRLFSPPADHKLSGGEQIIVVGRRESVDRLARTFCESE